MVSCLFLFIFASLINHGCDAHNNIVLKKRRFKPVEKFNDLVSFVNLTPVVPYLSSRLSSCEYAGTEPDLKYILLWTPADKAPFLSMGVGREGFIVRNCLHTNCYVSSTTGVLGNITRFDAVLFNGPDVKNLKSDMLPKERSPCQKYVFVSTQPSYTSPVFLPHFDSFFNWTWTYKLDSDLVWGSIVVALDNNTVIGPKPKMNWIKKDNMRPVSKALETILKGKTKAIAWFPSKCSTSSKREDHVRGLRRILELKYNLTIDVYGKCGDLECSQEDDDDEDCLEVIRNSYHFYLAYEDTVSEDYVTELLPAVKYNAVPIVYGGADYRRFLPEGSYLNARELQANTLAAMIHELMHDFKKYSEYFKWTNHYKYFSSTEHEDTDEYCKMCELLNDKSKLNKQTYPSFRKWWSPNFRKRYRARFTSKKTTAPKPTTVNSIVLENMFPITERSYYEPIPLETVVEKEQSRDLFGKFLDLADRIHNGLGLRKLLPSIKTLVEGPR